MLPAQGESEKKLMLQAARYNEALEGAYKDKAPHRLCSYIYELANAFNAFYHEIRILTQEDEEKKDSYLSLLELTRHVLEQCIELLGFSAPDRM